MRSNASGRGESSKFSELQIGLLWIGAESVEAMARFTGGDPTRIHHLPRDPEFLIELPSAAQVLRILASHGQTGWS